nr:hypothetical protein [Pseudomonas sp. A-B-19]
MDRSQLINSARSNIADLSRGNLGVPLLLLVMLAMMMLPVPPFLLDVFFTFKAEKETDLFMTILLVGMNPSLLFSTNLPGDRSTFIRSAGIGRPSV